MGENIGWMKRYIEHLIEDIEEARLKAAKNLAMYFNVPVPHDFDLYHDEEHTGIKVAELIGMEKYVFPNVDYLTDLEAEVVIKGFIAVYHAYGLNPIFEKCVTDRVMYGHLRHFLNYQVYPVENEIVDVEMCDYLPQYCPMHELCSNYNDHKVCCEMKKRA